MVCMTPVLHEVVGSIPTCVRLKSLIHKIYTCTQCVSNGTHTDTLVFNMSGLQKSLATWKIVFTCTSFYKSTVRKFLLSAGKIWWTYQSLMMHLHKLFSVIAFAPRQPLICMLHVRARLDLVQETFHIFMKVRDIWDRKLKGEETPPPPPSWICGEGRDRYLSVTNHS